MTASNKYLTIDVTMMIWIGRITSMAKRKKTNKPTATDTTLAGNIYYDVKMCPLHKLSNGKKNHFKIPFIS